MRWYMNRPSPYRLTLDPIQAAFSSREGIWSMATWDTRAKNNGQCVKTGASRAKHIRLSRKRIAPNVSP